MNVVERRVVGAGPWENPQGTEIQMPMGFAAAFGAAGPKSQLGRAQADAVKLGFTVITSRWLPVRLGKNSV